MPGKSKRGFASMDRARQREIAAKGGKAAHAKGTAHVWSTEEAREAGRKGGEVVSQDRSHMSAIGREGGESRSAMVRAARLAREQEVLNRAAAVTLEREVPITHGQLKVPLSDQLNGPISERPANGRKPLPAPAPSDAAVTPTVERA